LSAIDGELRVRIFMLRREQLTPRGGRAPRRILIVDDNPAIHADIRKILAPDSTGDAAFAASEAALYGPPDAALEVECEINMPVFRVDGAFQGEQAIALVRKACQARTPYAVAFVDARMPPGLDGIETIARLWQEDPDILVVLCTAYSDYSWQEIRRRLPRPDRLVILKKPFDIIEVQQLAECLTEKWRLARAERRRLEGLERMIGQRRRDASAGSRKGHRAAGRDAALGRTGIVAGTAGTERREAIKSALRTALLLDELYLHFQPLVDIATRCIVSVEALLRWQHPRLGAVSPAEFIPLAEESGFIVELGDFVLRSACAQTVTWQHAQVPVVPIAVNVSAVQLGQPRFRERILEILETQGAQPQHLILELTESTLMKNAAAHSAALHSLRTDGVCVELDDFGTGYSSLSRLKYLPIDTIKIDQSFIAHLGTDATDESIVSAILAMTHSLGLRAVAEGVESIAQLEVLGRYGCDIAQGYYFSKPVGAAECERLLIDAAARSAFTDTLRLRTSDLGALTQPRAPFAGGL
jgi:EAL domain-containing protein (putative c-di-GMP-specific phosphodiesterase class I)/CheY-like chemotaxis protein